MRRPSSSIPHPPCFVDIGRETLNLGHHLLCVFRFSSAFLLAGTLAASTAGAGVYRVTCKGILKMSSTTSGNSCAESGKLDDGHGRFLPSFSEAQADLGRGILAATAGGGAIRDVGYDGREATSVIIERFRLYGSWTGEMPIEITMKLRYRFAGEGESRLGVMLRSSTSDAVRGEHQAAVWMRHTGLGGAVVLAGDTRGRFTQPGDGAIASRMTVELKVVQRIDATAPDVEVRADLAAYALPNLGSFEESLTSLVYARGEIELAAPCPFRIGTRSRRIGWSTRTTAGEDRDRRFQC